jgi:hypothetical protein
VIEQRKTAEKLAWIQREISCNRQHAYFIIHSAAFRHYLINKTINTSINRLFCPVIKQFLVQRDKAVKVYSTKFHSLFDQAYSIHCADSVKSQTARFVAVSDTLR